MTVKCLVFVSRSERKDTDYASRLVSDLKKAKVDAQIHLERIHDEEIWRRTLLQDIATAEVIVVCLSPHGLTDKWLKREIFYARHNKNDTDIVLLMREKCHAEIASIEEMRQFSGPKIDGGEYSVAFPRLIRYFHQRVDDSQVRRRVISGEDGRAPETTAWLLGGVSGRPREDWGDARTVMGPFYGRKQVLADLEKSTLEDGCGLVALLGTGGIGKSFLAVKLVEGIKGHFEIVFWRDLRTSPRVERVISDFLRNLSGEFSFDLPPDIDGQVDLMLHFLRLKRCILVLDNMEPLLVTKDQGVQYREGYESYGKLIWRLGRTEHKSCLVLTSRERPPELDKLAAIPRIRIEPVGPLTRLEGREMLQGLGLRGSTSDLDALVDRYEGNPYALDRASYTIHRTYHGNVADFLKDAPVLYGGIHQLIEEQFLRLSDLEQQVMYWLAIERSPVKSREVLDDFVTPPGERVLFETLESLREKNLVEPTAQGYLLQSLVMKYVTDRLVDLMAQEVRTGQFNLFNIHALIKALSRDYVRETQVLSILKPVADALVAVLGKKGVEDRLRTVLSELRHLGSPRGYAGGNILNLLVHLKIPVDSFDFSKLCVWQAYLADVSLRGVNFAEADLSKSVFSEAFGNVLCVRYSPNGDYFAASTGTGFSVRLWKTSDNKLFSSLLGHTDWVWAIAFSRDSRLIATGSYDHTIRVWELSTARHIRTLYGHTGPVRSLDFHPSGDLLVSCGDDGIVRLWNLEAGRSVMEFEEHTDKVRSVAFCPADGSLIASGGDDSTVRVWDTRTKTCLNVFDRHNAPVWSVAFSPDGRTLASASDDHTIRVETLQNGASGKVLRGHTGGVYSIAFSPDGLILASGGEDGRIMLWNPVTGERYKTLPGHTKWVRSVAFSPRQHRLISGGEDHTVRIWDSDSGECMNTLQGYSNKIYTVAIDPTDSVIASGHEDYAVRLWDIASKQSRELRGPGCQIWSVAFHPNGNNLACGGYDPNVWVWDLDTGQSRALRGHTLPMFSVAYSPNGLLLASSNEDRTIRIWDAQTDDLKYRLQGGSAHLWYLAFGPDSALLAVGDGREVRIWKLDTGELFQTLQGHQDLVWGVAFNPDGTMLASCSDDRTVKLWDVTAAKCKLTLVGHTERVWSAAFILGGEQLVSGGNDKTIRVWDTRTGEPLDNLSGHNDQVTSIASNRSGSRFVSASYDETIRVWNAKTRECETVLHVDRIYERMNIRGATSLNAAQIITLRALGAIEE